MKRDEGEALSIANLESCRMYVRASFQAYPSIFQGLAQQKLCRLLYGGKQRVSKITESSKRVSRICAYLIATIKPIMEGVPPIKRGTMQKSGQNGEWIPPTDTKRRSEATSKNRIPYRKR